MSKGYDRVKVVLEKAHRHGLQNPALQQEALQASLGFLNTVDESAHWFCNDEIRTVVVEAMLLYSSPDSDALSWLQKCTQNALTRCYQCAEKYQFAAKKDLQRLVVDTYALANTGQYMERVNTWDQKRLVQVFENTLKAAKEQNKPLSDQKGPGFAAGTLCGLFECLWSPALSENSCLTIPFQSVFIGIQEGGKLLRVAGSILPAMYTFAFSTNVKLSEWSRKCFDKTRGLVNPAQFKLSGLEEVLKATRMLLTGSLGPANFWHGLQCILRYTDPAAIFSDLRDADVNLMDMICGEISSQTSNLQAVLQCLNTLMPALSSAIWSTCPMPAQEFGMKIIKNPKFADLLGHPESLKSFAPALEPLHQCLIWTRPYILSQFGGNKYRVAIQILHFLLDDVSQKELPSISKNACKSQAIRIVHSILLDLAVNSAKDSDRAFQIESRNLIDTFAKPLTDMVFDPSYDQPVWSAIRPIAVDILILTVKLDCDLLWSDYVSLSTTDFWASKDNKYSVPNSAIIWSKISENISERHIEVLQRFVEVVGQQIALIDTIEIQSRMAPDLRASIELFNRSLNSAMRVVNLVLGDIGGSWSAAQLKDFLARPSTNKGTIALMFSPNHETYQQILNLLKETHEAEGRVEALRSNFLMNFESTTEAFLHVISSWSAEGIFKSAVRIVRTAANILDVLFSARNGLVSTSEVHNLPAVLFRKLWQALWEMLETAYRMALPWADKFDKEDLIEFMRDVLECSNLLLEKFKAFEKVIAGNAADQKTQISSEKQKELDNALLTYCLRSVKSLTTWLRLNNEELLQSCVNLVCDILGRLARADIKITDDTIFIFDRLIVNSKKHKNCLTEAQRTEIFIALSDHTNSAEDPNDVQVITSDQMPKQNSVDTKAASSVYDQMQLAAARKSVVSSLEKHRLPSVSTKPATRPPTPMVVNRSTMTPRERAEFLAKRSGALPAALQARKVVAKNASAGTIRRDDSSASESDSDDDIEGLFTTVDPKGPTKKRVEKRPIQKLEPSNLAQLRKDPRFERNRIEKNIRARTNPDLTDLHMRLLAWNPVHDGSFPPDTEKKDYAKLVDSFPTAERYRKSVEPLFLLETWQHVVSSRENIKEKDKFELVLQTRSAVDNFVDLIATMSQADWKQQLISDPDLLMLSTSTSFNPKSSAVQGEYCLAKVQSVYKKKETVEIGLRTVPNSGMVKHLRPTVRLYCVKLSGLTPIHREYATLKALPYYDLCEEIVTGRPTKALAAHPQDIEKMMKAYGVNEPQAYAIDAALNNEGFTLIQGPPGTGKTKTILGMVGAFLSQSRLQGNAITLPGQRQVAKKEEVKKKKILLCAPSNAAVDEIVLRLKHGILTDKGELYVPKIVRMGMSDAINVNVQDVTLDALLDDMLNRADEKITGGLTNDPTAIREKLNATLKERDVQRSLLEKARAEMTETSEIERQIKVLNTRKTQLGEQLDELRDKQSQKARAKDIERKKFQTQILADADVICATLSGSGHDLMASIAMDFETVIIDEACQTTELSALIPLKYGCTRCIMVGDPKQLPPTVLSTEAVEFAYNESLFVRMQRNSKNCVRLLAIQYRMHSSISRFPSQQFYQGQLLDGPEVDEYTRRAWHNSTIFGTYRFFDIKGREEESNKHSMYNMAEVKATLAIYRRLQEDFFDVDFDGRIGIVTPYKEQHNQIRRLFQQQYGQNILSAIDFNTVDGFQGQEKDIIIFSCVRANENRGIGFLSDVRRMNVGLTRAKSSVFILGNSAALDRDKTWRALVQDAKSRNVYTNVNASTFEKPVRLSNQSPSTSKSKDMASFKRPPSPIALVKEEVRKIKTDHEARAPIDAEKPRRSALLEPVKKPERPAHPHIKKETKDTEQDVKPPCIKTESIDTVKQVKQERSDDIKPMHIKKEEGHANHKDKNSSAIKPEPQESQLSADRTSSAPQPIKRKAEPQLFIKRKKPTR